MNNSNGSDSVIQKPLFIELNENLPEYSSIVSDSPVLNSMVRNTYFQYIQRIIENGAIRTKTDLSKKDINKLAQRIELNALKFCMSSKIYRCIMLNEIKNIKYSTSNEIPFVREVLQESKQLIDYDDSSNLYSKHLGFPSKDLDEIVHNNSIEIEQNESNINTIQLIEENIKTEPIPDEYCPIDTDSQISSTNIDIKNENSVSQIFDGNEGEETKDFVYDKVCQEMEQIFAPNNVSSIDHSHTVNLSSSPTSTISSNQYFTHRETNFWSLEYEIRNAQFHQIISTIYELNEQKYEKVVTNIQRIFQQEIFEIENTQYSLKKVTYKCKERITWHVKKSLSLYYREKRFRSLDEFRILAKSIVTSFLQIDPFMEYKYIHKAISKIFNKKKSLYVQNITHIQYIVSKVSEYMSQKLNLNNKYF